MKSYFECYPCYLRQAVGAARRANASDEQTYQILHQSLSILQEASLEDTSPYIGMRVHHLVRELCDAHDPYRQDKIKNTQQALEIYPRLKSLVASSSHPLDTALRLSIAGNIIDLGVKENVDDIWQTVERVLEQPYAIDDTLLLKQELESADWLLYLGDNAGETVFDRVLIELLPMPVVYVVRGEPIINDVTLEDALAAGLDGCTTLLSNGSGAPGTVLSLCSDEFLDHFERAPLIIAKGQGNYESLSEAGKKVFCLLQAKCPVVGHDLAVPLNSIVARQSTAS